MGRPDNWQELIAEHGWGTAPERIKKRSKPCEESGCVVWAGGVSGNGHVPQIRVSVPGYVWTETVTRLVWMLRNKVFVPEGMEVRRTCCNSLCVRHLSLVERGKPASLCAIRNMREGARRGNRDKRALSPQQVAAVRRYAAEGRNLAQVARRYGVSSAVVYSCANGFSYLSGNEAPPRRGPVGRYRRNPRPADIAATDGEQ